MSKRTFQPNNRRRAKKHGFRARMRTRAGRDVAIETRIDPEILGGIVIKMGSQMIDASIRTKLNRLAEAMKG